jgi:hypothetical protein
MFGSTVKNELKNNVERIAVDLSEVLYRQPPGGNEENH